MFPDHEAATNTVVKIQELNAVRNVLVLLARDDSLKNDLPLFPNRAKDWAAQGLRDKTRWLFCKEMEYVEL